MDVVEEIVDYVKSHDWATFVEIERIIESHEISVRGTFSKEVVPNGIIWADMSKEFCDIVDSVAKTGSVTLDTGHWLAYLADGGMMKLPLAKRLPKDIERGYAKPRWIPTFFRPKT